MEGGRGARYYTRWGGVPVPRCKVGEAYWRQWESGVSGGPVCGISQERDGGAGARGWEGATNWQVGRVCGAACQRRRQ